MQRIVALFLFVLVIGFAAMAARVAVYARDGGASPAEALQQYQKMQEKVRTQNERPAPVKRTTVHTSPFALPAPKQLKAAPAVPPSLFVHVLGDSLAQQLAKGLTDVLDDRPDIAIIDNGKADSGLVRNDFYDWNKAVADMIATGDRIDAVVIMIGSNDRQPMMQGTTRIDLQSDAWQQAYIKRIDAFLAPLKAKGIKIFWTGLPPMKKDELSAGMVRLNSLYRERVAAAGGAYVDIWDGFVDEDGSYAGSGSGLDGQPALLRKVDGVHFSDEGARIAAHFVETELRRALGDAPPAPLVATAPVAEPGPAGPTLTVEKPEYGPVLPLSPYETTPGGALLGGPVPVAAKGADPSVIKVLSQGEIPPPREGRGDDFRWPPP